MRNTRSSDFVLIDIQEFLDLPMFEGYTDLEFCEWMIKNIKVAASAGVQLL